MSSLLDAELRARLDDLGREGLARHLRTVSGAHGPRLTLDGQDVLCFTSNNYLGFAHEPALESALGHVLETHGLGAAASRLVSGTLDVHVDAEAALARFAGHERALLFSSGYAANVGLLQALGTHDDLIVSDALNHASLIDGSRLSNARVVVTPHGDTGAVREILASQRATARRAFVVTEAVFSMDGDRADLRELRAICDEFDAALVVDEAHALGMLGRGGRGLADALGVRADVYVGTLGKAFGGFGAFVASSATVIDWLVHRARSFVFSTAVPPILAASALAALPLVEAADDRRRAVLTHADALRDALRARGLRVGGDGSGIVPLIVGDAAAAVALTDALLARGVFVQAIRPPTVPEGTSRLRITPIATHSAADVNALLVALEETLDGRAPGANGPIAGGTAKGGRARAASHRRGTGA